MSPLSTPAASSGPPDRDRAPGAGPQAGRAAWALPALVWGIYAAWAWTGPAGFFMEDETLMRWARLDGLDALTRLWTDTVYRDAAAFNYRPLAATLYGAAGGILGLDPHVFRSLNLLFLAITALALGGLARRLGAVRAAAAILPLALLLHPAVPNLFCWAVGAFDLSAGMFAALGLWAAARPAGPEARRGLAVGAALLAACLCKESAAPLALALVAVAGLAAGRRAAFATGLGAALAGAIWLCLWTRHAAAVGGAGALGPPSLAWLQYLGWFAAFPPGTAAVYHLFDPADLAGAAAGACLAVAWLLLGGAALTRPDTRRGGAALLAALGVVAVALVPGAVLVPRVYTQPVRYLYLPFLAALPLLLSAWPAAKAAGLGRAAAGLGLLWLGWHGAYSLRQPAAWRTEPTLWAAEYRTEPSYKNATLLAKSLVRAASGQPAFAASQALLTWAIEATPKDGRPIKVRPAELYSWRAVAAWCAGDRAAALADAQQAAGWREEGALIHPGADCILATGSGAPDAAPRCAAAGPLCAPEAGSGTWTTD